MGVKMSKKYFIIGKRISCCDFYLLCMWKLVSRYLKIRNEVLVYVPVLFLWGFPPVAQFTVL